MNGTEISVKTKSLKLAFTQRRCCVAYTYNLALNMKKKKLKPLNTMNIRTELNFSKCQLILSQNTFLLTYNVFLGYICTVYSRNAFLSIRFLLQMFMEARCYDWWLILSLVLRDRTCLTDFIDDAIKLHDTNVESLCRMKDGIEALEAWAEHNW